MFVFHYILGEMFCILNYTVKKKLLFLLTYTTGGQLYTFWGIYNELRLPDYIFNELMNEEKTFTKFRVLQKWLTRLIWQFVASTSITKCQESTFVNWVFFLTKYWFSLSYEGPAFHPTFWHQTLLEPNYLKRLWAWHYSGTELPLCSAQAITPIPWCANSWSLFNDISAASFILIFFKLYRVRVWQIRWGCKLFMPRGWWAWFRRALLVDAV